MITKIISKRKFGHKRIFYNKKTMNKSILNLETWKEIVYFRKQ